MNTQKFLAHLFHHYLMRALRLDKRVGVFQARSNHISGGTIQCSCFSWRRLEYNFSNVKWPTRLLIMLVSKIFIANFHYLSIFDDTHFCYSCSVKVNANSLSIDNKGYTTMVNFCRKFIGKECLIYTIKGFRKDKFHKMCELASDM